MASQTYFVTQENEAFGFDFVSPTDVTITDNSTEELSIGFDFNFFGNTYTTCHLSENGFIQFGNSPEGGCCAGQFLPSQTNPDNLIAAAWMDGFSFNCCYQGDDYTVFQYETIGSEPNRVFVVTLSLEENCGAYYSGQIKLYEGADIIEIHTDSWADGSSPCSNVTQGIENIDGTEAYYWFDRNANTSWNVPCCGDVVRFTPSYALPQNDAGVSYIFNTPPCEGTQTIEVLVTNYGANALDSIVLDWTWDDIPQDSLFVDLGFSLMNGQSTVIEIGSQSFVSGEEYAITAWTRLPNGVSDDYVGNDTISSTIATGARDTFTIGGTSPDFTTFAAAITFLETTGVCDTTWMLVRPGTYNEQLTVPWIPGASSSQVIFTAENGDSSSVILQFDPTNANSHVVKFNNTAGITWERMTINALGLDFGRVFQFSLHSFDNRIQHCAINGINTSSASDAFACIYSDGTNSGNVFLGNTIKNGSYGILHDYFSSYVEGFDIRQNQIENFSTRGLQIAYTSGLQVVGNTVISSKNAAIGIDVSSEIDSIVVSNNTVELSSGQEGIRFSSIDLVGGGRGAVFNNMIYVNHASAAVYGLRIFEMTKTDVYHNTIKVSGPATANVALHITYASQDSFFNNLITSSGGGSAVYVGTANLSMMDYNGYHHTGLTFGKYDSGAINIDNLAEWQSLTGFDVNATFFPPYFLSMTNLHLGNSYFNGQGSPIWAPTYDIDGDDRNNANPDPGADEFFPETLDASIADLLSPAVSCDTFQNIEVVLINLGSDTLTDASIQWTLNGNAQTPVVYSGELLPEGDTAHILIQSLAPFDDQTDTLRFWAEDLNGDDDLFMLNDTLTSTYSLSLSGAYTIGGVSPDFATIADAVSALQTFAICGPVTFLLRNGTYTEQFSIDSIPGASTLNTITFSSENQDSSLVTIQFNSTSTTNYIVQLNGAKHIRFEHLGFKTINTTYANIFFLRDGAGDVRIEHCYLEGRSPTIVSGNSYLCYTNDTFDGNVTLRNNYFLNGTRAIYLLGNVTPAERQDSFIIEDNRFVNQRTGAILAQQIKDISIGRNSVVSNTTATYTGIQLTSSHGTNTVTLNKVNLTSTGDGITINGVNSESSLPGLCKVYNNMSSVVSGSAFTLSTNRRLQFVYNTGYSAGTTASSHHAIKLFGGDSITVQNNIGVANAGRAYSETFYIPIVNGDYNNYYTNGTELAYRANTPYADLASWQAGTNLDSNSLSINPLFVSSSDLHILASGLHGAAVPQAGITTDIDNQLRDAVAPDIGADEIGTEPFDAGILNVLPEMPFARGLQDVKAIVRNHGSDTLYTAVISWELNGDPQPDYYYSGELPSLGEDTIILGELDFELSTAYQFTIWTSLPNQVMDSNPLNDTLNQSAIYPAVSGTVVVGATGEVLTISNAVSAMALGGILDSIRFELQSGTYHESVSLNAAPFLTCGAQVVFTSVTGNAADVIWDNLGTGTHTVLFDGADGIEMSHLTIKTFIDAFQAIRFQNASACNHINHCIVEGVSSDNTSSSYAAIRGVSTGSTNYNHNNTIQYNTIIRGSYNIHWDGATGTTGLNVNYNALEDAYVMGLLLYRLKAPRADYNTVTSNSSNSLFIGVYGESCAENTSITGNKILLHGKRSYGIQFYLSNGTVSLPARIANNFIIGGSGAGSLGLYAHTCNYVHVYHNTIRISGGDNTGTNILRHSGGNILFLNNILDNQANGKTMQFNGSGTPLTTNYNIHFTEGTNLINYLGTNYTALAAWQATGRDVNSQHVEPLYDEDSPLSYMIENAEMNGMAISGTNTPDDIEGMPRDTSMPDIGCDEFDLFTHDVGIAGITYPHLPFPEGLNTVYIKFINNGVDTLTSMEVNWEIDSVPQPTYMWTGLLPSAGTYDSLDIGEFNFAARTFHEIKVWVSEPNGVQDELAINDTLRVDSLYPGLHGTYTIGGFDPDFESITEAVAELNKGGASEAVTFNIRSGTYLDTISINDFPGSDCDRPVIFQSESGNREDVLITNLGYDAHTIVLNGADGVTFQNLRIASVNPAYRHVVSYYNGAHCNQFINNILIGFEGTTTASSAAVIYSETGLDTQNVFSGNLIQYGSYGFYSFGAPSGVAGTIIEGNTFDQPYNTGVYAKWEYNIRVDHNVFNAAENDMNGVVLYLCQNVESVSNNIFHLPDGGYGLYIEDCDNLVSSPALIANNFISIGGTNIARGIYMIGSSYYTILHNNFHITTTHTGQSVGVPMYLTSNPSLKVYNNNFSNAGVGYGIYANNNTSFLADHNNYYVPGAYLGYWNGTARTTLSDWQTATSQDLNALEINPQYMSDSNLHVSNVLLNGAGLFQALVPQDIDGESRQNPPDIGADEFDPSIANDAGVFMAVGPHAPFAHGSQPINLAIKNFGTDTLTSVNVRWVVNGIEQPLYTWTGALPSAQCDTVTISTFNFPEYTAHDVIYWTESPNNIPDSTSINDTLHLTNVYPALSGPYTVGGVLPDFNLFSQLERALHHGGILNDVTFSIRNGTYVSQLLIENFPRLSSAHTVTFSSASGDSSLVSLTRNFAIIGDNNYTVRLKDAHGIRFENISLASTKGRVLELMNNSSDVVVANCHIKGVQLQYAYGGYELIYSGTTSEDSITIANNYFEFGEQGIYMLGSSGDKEKHHIIENNHFNNCFSRSIYSRYTQDLQLNQNTISNSLNYHQGIVVSFLSGNVSISGNDIRLLAGGYYGMSIYASNGTALLPIQVNNNYILARNSSNATLGIAQEACNYVKYNYNTVRIENVASSSLAFVDAGSNSNIHVRNCIFSNESGGKAISTSWAPPYSNNTLNHCNLYATGPVLAYYSIDYVDHATFKAGSGQNLLGVSVESLFDGDGPDVLQAALDGEAIPVSGVTTDIYGAARNGSTPDIGAREFTLLAHDVGAKLLESPGTYCGLSEMESVTIRIQNYGSSTETGFNVGYKMNQSSWVIENIGSLFVLPGEFLDFTFSVPENMMEPGVYDFELITALATDLNTANDSLHDIMVEHIPALTMPVSNMIPVDGTLDLEKTVSFSWLPAENATRYDIYIWPDGDPQPGMPQVSNLTQINTLYSQLSYGTLYNWQVVAKNVCNNMMPGPVQQFFVRHLPDLIVESMIIPSTAFSEQTISVEWVIDNQGLGVTNPGTWFDNIYLSNDATYNSFDPLLASVPNLAYLNPAESYAHSASVILPQGTNGLYYIIIKTDHFGATKETSENNNTSYSATQMNVTLSPPSDLIVTEITTPVLAFSGQTIGITYRVNNIGDGITTNSIWKDLVTLVPDPSNEDGLTALLLTKTHIGNLLPDSSYLVSTQVVLPPNIYGDYNIRVYTDSYNDVFEYATEGNNTLLSNTLEIVLTPPPDLQVDSLMIPDSVSLYKHQSFSYNVKNQGGSAPTRTWTDRYYLSPSPVYNPNFLIPLGYAYHNAGLTAGDYTKKTTSVRLTGNFVGTYYLYVFTDYNNLINEYEFEENNIFRSGPLTIIRPDMVVDSLIHAPFILSGNTLSVQAELVNNGPGVYNGTFSSRYYLSVDSLLSPTTDQLLTTRTIYNTDFSAPDTLDQNVSFIIPVNASGPYYLICQTDATGTIFESEESNNTLATPLTIFEAPHPDLTTISMDVPDTVIAGVDFEMHYEVVNQGDVPIFQSAVDSIFISFSPTWDRSLAMPLGKRSTTLLDTSQSVLYTVSLSTPITQNPNYYYIYILNDALQNVFEGSGEANNILRSDTFALLAYPGIDLELDQIEGVPDTLISGQTLSVDYDVTNLSGYTSYYSSWTEKYYFSSDSLFNPSTDMALGVFAYPNGALAASTSTTISVDLQIPEGITGDYYLFIETDEQDVNNDINRSNNANTPRLAGVARKIHVKLDLYPDLQPVDFVAPVSVVSGQFFSILTNVSNMGTGLATGRVDKIFASTNSTIDNGDLLLFSLQQGSLASNTSKTDSFSVFLPANYFGNYYLIYSIDHYNYVFEYNQEGNNILLASIIAVPPPPADLLIKNILVPDSVLAGHTADLTWQTENQGLNPAYGQLREIVYLSPDTAWSITDEVIGIWDGFVSISPGSTTTKTVPITYNNVTNADYHTIVRTDARNNILESDEDNNDGFSFDLTNVDIEEIFIDVAREDTLYPNQIQYYKLNIGADEAGSNVLISLAGDSLIGVNELYVKYGAVPTTADHDLAFTEPFSPHQQVLVRDAQPGFYYIMCQGYKVGNSAPQPIQVHARIILMEILSVSPEQGGNKGYTTLEAYGSNLDSIVIVKLVQVLEDSTQYHEIVADTFILVGNGESVVARFNLEGQPLGHYHLLCLRESIWMASYEYAFEIIEGSGSSVAVNWSINPTQYNARFNQKFQIKVDVENTGDADAQDRFIRVGTSNQSNLVYYSLDDYYNRIENTQLMLPIEDMLGFPGVLRPGGRRTYYVYGEIGGMQGFSINYDK